MSTQRPPPRRRSARLAFGSEEQHGSSLNNGPPQPKRVKQDEGKTPHRKIGGMTSLGERALRKTPALYDEEDDGFRFTRARSKKVQAARSIPEPVPEDEEVNGVVAKNLISEAIVPKEDQAKPRKRRSARLLREGEAMKRPERVRSKENDMQHKEPEEEEQERRVEVETAGAVEDTQKIALPFSDTPVIKRNKEFRRQASQGHRRSSTGLRGRRASSLIESGSDALPHPDVPVAEYYKHIEADALSEPRRMKQLLVWCGSRALNDDPRSSPSAETGARVASYAVLKDLLRDFSRRSEMSDWFGREVSRSVEVVRKANPRNVANLAKIEVLEAKVRRLQEERRTWEAFAKRPSLVSSSVVDASGSTSMPTAEPSAADGQCPTVDVSLLDDAHQCQLLSSLQSFPDNDHGIDDNDNENNTVQSLIKRLQATMAPLELNVDLLTQGIHRFGQYQTTAERVADRILASAAIRLEQRQQAVLDQAGTRNIPLQEVLRGLAATMDR